VPLPQPSSDATPDYGSNKVCRRCDLSADKSIKQTVFETCEQWRRKSTLCKESMRLGFPYSPDWKLAIFYWTKATSGRLYTFTIYQNFRMISIRSHQHGLTVYLLLCHVRLPIDNFQKLHTRPFHVNLSPGGPRMFQLTVFVIPSVNRTNPILFPCPSHSGLRVRTSLRAEVCESAWV
jgi:hypothetical protein